MENLNLEKFSPKKAEIIALVEDCKNLTIKDAGDREGYKIVVEKRKELKKTRVAITKTGKMLRAEAISFQKAVIEKEREMTSLIEPTEKDLAEKQKVIDDELTKIARMSSLPKRQEDLKEINVEIEEDFILLMDDNKFKEFFNEKKSEYLEEKERLAEEERQKIEDEKEKLADEKRIEEEKQKARKEERKQAEEEAKLAKEKAEQDKLEAIEAEKKKAEEEKQKLIEEQKKKEADVLAKIEEEKRNKKEQEDKEKEAQDKLEKQKKYQDFLKKNGYSEENKNDYIIVNESDKITLFKKVDEFINK